MCASRSRFIEIDQILHGYQDGHRRLGASAKLSDESERTLLILSDMTGPSMVAGFERYITAYPLPLDQRYAFAMTWYAPEMERPGCVWTHTLLIRFSDLAVVPSFKFLLRFFHRPNSSADHVRYTSTINTEFKSIEYPFGTSHEEKSKAVRLLELLYGRPDDSLICVSGSAREYEELILAIWSQQWPRLRREFAFCTGSIVERSLPRGKFDIQFVSKDRGNLSRTHKLTGDAEEAQAWLHLASYDLFEPGPSELRAFLREFGAEVDRGRAAFRPLVNILGTLSEFKSSDAQYGKVLELATEAFSSPDQANRLKSMLLGISVQNRWVAQVPSTAAVLAALVETRNLNALAGFTRQLRELASVTWHSHPKVALEILKTQVTKRKKLSSVLKAIVMGFTDAMEEKDIESLEGIGARVLVVLVEQNPRLLTFPTLWRISSREGEPLLVEVLLKKTAKSTALTRQATVATLIAGAFQAFRTLLNARPEPVLNALLRSIVSNELDLAGTSAFKDILVEHRTAVLQWIKKHDCADLEVLIFAVDLYEPGSTKLADAGFDIWRPLARTEEKSVAGRDVANVKMSLLSAALQSDSRGAAEIASYCFPSVYKAVKRGHVGSDQFWFALSAQLPESFFFLFRPAVVRLRQGYIQRFIEFDWPVEYLRTLLRDSSLRDEFGHDSYYYTIQQKALLDQALEQGEARQSEE